VAARKKKQSSGKRIGKGASRKRQEPALKQRLIKAMTHSLRFQILTMLNDREWSPNELSEELAEGLSQVSYHIKVLRDFGLIEMTKTRPARGAVEHFYRAIERTIIYMDMAKDMPASGRGIVINSILGEVNDDVNEAVEAGLYDSRDEYHVNRIPMVLDDQGCKDAYDVGVEYVHALLEIAGQSGERLLESENPKPIGMSAVILLFPSKQSEREKGLPVKRPGSKKSS
jgi:DNA-binding transcriptional ArsR family regulator